MTDVSFLPGLKGDSILAALRRKPGNEVGSGKFASPESSTALVANAFGLFLDRAASLPPLPGVPMGQPESVDLAAEMHFPWRGGRHPWLDVALTTATTLVGIHATRYEPFRPQKSVPFTEDFGSRDWGAGMQPYDCLRQDLAAGKSRFQTLNAALLVKQAYALRHQATRRGRGSVLVYLYSEPLQWASGKAVDPDQITRHRSEIGQFAAGLAGADVVFCPLRWADLLAQWSATPALAAHAAALTARFGPL